MPSSKSGFGSSSGHVQPLVISVLGTPIPNTPHAVSVCLPTWQDNVDYEEGLPRVHSALRSGYPRFVYHKSVRALFALCLGQLSKPGPGPGDDPEDCLVFPSLRVATECREFILKLAPEGSKVLGDHSLVRIEAIRLNGVSLSVVVFPKSLARTAKHFWQHSGEIPSSRLAEFACRKGQNPSESEELDEYVEEHYGRNMSWSSASGARNALRRRISDASGEAKQNVFLFPCGMSAIYNAHRFLRKVIPGLKAVQFGFPYLDTLMIVQKFGAGGHFFGQGDEADLDQLEKLLETEKIMGLFCEFPSNPLLKCANLRRLRALAGRHSFPIVIDDTLGTFKNIDVLPFADIVVTSLTKVFSGDSNVMGGSMVLNSKGKHYKAIFEVVQRDYEDLLWSQDAVFLERNSRTFGDRVQRINENTEKICEFLRAHPKGAFACSVFSSSSFGPAVLTSLISNQSREYITPNSTIARYSTR